MFMLRPRSHIGLMFSTVDSLSSCQSCKWARRPSQGGRDDPSSQFSHLPYLLLRLGQAWGLGLGPGAGCCLPNFSRYPLRAHWVQWVAVPGLWCLVVSPDGKEK